MAKMKFRQLESYIGKELQNDYNKVQMERARLYDRTGQNPGAVKRALIYITLTAAALFGGSMATGLVNTEDVKDAYKSVKSFVTGQENPDTIDNRVEGGN
jgi:hypothetical protein